MDRVCMCLQLLRDKVQREEGTTEAIAKEGVANTIYAVEEKKNCSEDRAQFARWTHGPLLSFFLFSFC